MPIYEYRCPKCGDFDIMQKITEGPLRKCPTCKAKVTKLMSSTAFQLKGSGWYITDYGRGGKKGGGEAGKSETSGAAGADSGSSSTEKTSASTDTSSSEKKPAKGKAKSGGESSAAA